MFSTRPKSEVSETFSYPITRVKNLVCVRCKHNFHIRDIFNLRGPQLPLLYHCGHPVCERCSIQFSTCEICPGESQAKEKEESSELLQLNVYILGLLEMSKIRPVRAKDPEVQFCPPLASRFKPLTKRGQCHECGKMAMVECQQCSVILCDFCFKKIHSRALQGHKKISLLSESANLVPLGGNICDEHTNFVKDYYCLDCKVTVCCHCILEHHNVHHYVKQEEKNAELLDDFEKAYSKVGETLQRVQFAQRKILQILKSPSNQQEHERMESLITQHFTFLHGLLQTIEKELIRKLYSERNELKKNLMQMLTNLAERESELHSALWMSSAAKENLNIVNMTDVIETLKTLSNTPCYLVKDREQEAGEFSFEINSEQIESIRKHCKLEVPQISGFSLVEEKDLPEHYEIEQLKEDFLKNIRIDSQSPLLERSCSTPSLSYHRGKSNVLTDGVTVMVRITHITNPSQFYVQQISHEKKLQELQNSLQDLRVTSSKPVEIKLNTRYGVKSNRHNVWFRGVVTEINQSENTCTVFYIDFGKTESHVKFTNLRKLYAQHNNIPAFATECSLFDIVPANDEWQPEALEYMKILIQENDVLSMHIFHTIGSVYYVDLSKNQNGIFSVRDGLVFTGHGCFVTSQKLVRTNPQSLAKILKEDMKLDKFHTVYGCNIESPDSIYVQKITGYRRLQNLLNDMKDYYTKTPKEKCSIYIPEIGLLCAAPNDDGFWYRAEICGLPGNQMVEIFYVDLGYKRVLKHDMIRKLHCSFSACQAQAIKLSLKDVAPLEDGQNWSNEINSFLKDRLFGQVFKVLSFEKVGFVHKVCIVMDESTNLNSHIVRAGMARSTGMYSQSLEMPVIRSKTYRKKEQKLSITKLKNELKKLKKQEQKEKMYVLQEGPDPFSVRVVIKRADSPACIYVSQSEKEEENKKMINNLQHFYATYAVEKRVSLKVDELCVAYCRKDKEYYRGLILEQKSPSQVLVSLYDVGMTEVFNASDIQPMHETFTEYPSHVFKIKLAGIYPCGGSSTWATFSCEKLQDILSENQNRNFYISKVEDTVGDVIAVELFVEQSTDQGALLPHKMEIHSVNRMLIDAGGALPVKGFADKKIKILALELKKELNKLYRSQESDTYKWVSSDQSMSQSYTNGDTSETSFMVESFEKSTSNNSSSEDELSSENTLRQTETNDWIPAEPIVADEFIAKPTYIDNNCNVYLHSIEENSAKLNTICRRLAGRYKHTKNNKIDTDWNEGDLCIVQYHTDKKWYRGRVKKIQNADTLMVEFVDYGNVEECTIENIQKRIAMKSIPIQCTKCVVHGLIPDNKSGKWSTSDLDKIHAALVDSECKVHVLQRTPTHLLISITLLKHSGQSLITYLSENINMRLKAPSANSTTDDDEAYVEETEMDDTADVLIEQYIEDTSEIQKFDTLSSALNLNKHEEINGENEEINGENEGINGENEGINGENEEINGENDEINGENDKINGGNEEINGENDEINGENEEINGENDEINGENEEADDCVSKTSHTLNDVDLNDLDEDILDDLENIMENDKLSTSTPCNQSLENINRSESIKNVSHSNESQGYQHLHVPEYVKMMKIEMTTVITATVFYGHIISDFDSGVLGTQYMAFQELTAIMQEEAAKQPIVEDIFPQMPCCLKYQDDKWYRAVIGHCEKISATETEIHVTYVDYGNVEIKTVANTDLRCLKDEWFRFPAMAVLLCMSGVEPVHDVSVSELCAGLEKMFTTKPLVAKVKDIRDDHIFVELYTDDSCQTLSYTPLVEAGMLKYKTKTD